MRIRTIKPEFWTHPVMVQQDDAVKLLAIGLLNFADDEGYFYAEPKMVRAALRPLDEDSTIVRRSIEQLEKIGYVITCQHPTHGLLGRIVSFTDHQRIDRPRESKIQSIWPKKPSTINRRSFDDHSPLEGKGKEQGTGKVISDAFDQFWAAWPKKKAKVDAQKAFAKCKVPLEVLLSAILRQSRSDEWKKDNGKYIPHPATWINGRRWEDDEGGHSAKELTDEQKTENRRKAQEKAAAECAPLPDIFGVLSERHETTADNGEEVME